MCNQRRPTWLAALAAAALVAVAPLAADQSGDDKAMEKSLDAGLRDVINLGATIFNNQDDHAGCYRLFDGALRATKPLLGKYPDLQRKVDVGLVEASKLPRMHDRAHALRKLLDEIRATVNPSVRPVAKTLWDRLGGEKGVHKVLSDVITAAAVDPKVDFTRGGKFVTTPQQAQALHKSLLDFVSNATGGPFKYSGPNMREAHRNMGITDAQFDALAFHLKVALERSGAAPADINEVLGAVAGTRPDIVEPSIKKIEEKPADPPLKKPEDKPAEKKAATLWDRLGGAQGVDKVLSDFLPAAAADPKVDFTRGKKFDLTALQGQILQKSLFDFVSSATGGPFAYTGRTMKDVHKGMGITDEQFDALAGHLKNALEKNGVAPDDVKALLNAVAGTRSDIVENGIKKDVPVAPDPPNKKLDVPELPVNKTDNKQDQKVDPNLARGKGTVSLGGQVITTGFVTFVNPSGQRFSANIKNDGSFAFRKGFPPGDYIVFLEDASTAAAFGDLRMPIAPQYSDPATSPLRFTAAKGENNFNFATK